VDPYILKALTHPLVVRDANACPPKRDRERERESLANPKAILFMPSLFTHFQVPFH
jgi:hypothetical protein